MDAVQYYVELLAKGLSKRYSLSIQAIYSLDDIESNDIIIVLDAKTHFLIWLRDRSVRVVSWFQGILPEENKMSNPKFSLVNSLRIRWWEFLESFSLKKSFIKVFVSEAMAKHYQEKYKFVRIKDNEILMPCYNKQLKTGAFYESRYTNPSFVYAGSLAEWQCFEETLQLFKCIKRSLIGASLTIYTQEIEKANQVLKEYDLTSVAVEYVGYKDIDDKLQKFKYAFLLRKNHIVNKVATPTKMNTYLANGLIPIYSDAVDYFRDNLSQEIGICLNAPFDNNIQRNAEKIIEFERTVVDSKNLHQSYNTLFSRIYDDDIYISIIASKRS